MMKCWIPFDELYWSSDWNGDEVGYPELDVVGLYIKKTQDDFAFYIDMENMRILECLYLGEVVE